MEARRTRYKRSSGTRWVEHQANAIDSYFKNRPVLIGFLNQQIVAPHNNSMKKNVPRMQGLEMQIAKVNKIIFMGVKQDVLEIIRPLSKILQDNDLLSPKLFTAIINSRKSIKKIQKLLRECGEATFTNFPQFFPTASVIIFQLKESDEIVTSDRKLRSREGNSHRNSSIQGFQLRGRLENAIEQTKDQMVTILGALVDIYDTRFADIIENPIYKAASVFLDTSSYTEVGEGKQHARNSRQIPSAS